MTAGGTGFRLPPDRGPLCHEPPDDGVGVRRPSRLAEVVPGQVAAALEVGPVEIGESPAAISRHHVARRGGSSRRHDGARWGAARDARPGMPGCSRPRPRRARCCAQGLPWSWSHRRTWAVPPTGRDRMSLALLVSWIHVVRSPLLRRKVRRGQGGGPSRRRRGGATDARRGGSPGWCRCGVGRLHPGVARLGRGRHVSGSRPRTKPRSPRRKRRACPPEVRGRSTGHEGRPIRV